MCGGGPVKKLTRLEKREHALAILLKSQFSKLRKTKELLCVGVEKNGKEGAHAGYFA